MKKNILSEINRSREIMGLPSIDESQNLTSTPQKHLSEVNRILEMMDLPLLSEQDIPDILGFDPEEECPCDDGSFAPECCEEYTDEELAYFDELERKENTPPSIANDYRQFPELKELMDQPLSVILAKLKEIHPTTEVSMERQRDGVSNAFYHNMGRNIAEIEKIVNMSDEEFQKLSINDKVMYGRTLEEREQAIEQWKIDKKERDALYAEKLKNSRIKSSQTRKDRGEKEVKSLSKLLKVFIKKLDSKSEKRWNNEDKQYNSKGWVMTPQNQKELFQIFKDYLLEWSQDNPKLFREASKRYTKVAKKYFSKINLKNVKGPDEVIEFEDESEDEFCPIPPVILPLELFAFGEGEFDPFENNSTALKSDLTNEIDKLIDIIAKFKDENTGYVYKVTEYKILTSANRARNGGAVKDWSFEKLSGARANSVKQYVDGKLSSIGVQTISPTIDSKGTNGDGSSGPNPPSPFSMALGSGPERDTNESNRDKYGEVDTSCKNIYGGKFKCPTYDKFKYVGLELVVEGFPPEVEGEEPLAVKGEESEPVVIPTRKWEISFIPRKKYTKKYKKKLTWPKITLKTRRIYWKPQRKGQWGSTKCAKFNKKDFEINFFAPSGLKIGPVLQDAINNNMASYGSFTFTTKE